MAKTAFVGMSVLVVLAGCGPDLQPAPDCPGATMEESWSAIQPSIGSAQVCVSTRYRLEIKFPEGDPAHVKAITERFAEAQGLHMSEPWGSGSGGNVSGARFVSDDDRMMVASTVDGRTMYEGAPVYLNMMRTGGGW